MVSQAKLNQIPVELKRHGVEPTQQHIDAVASMLESDGRASVSSAVKRYAEQSQAKPHQPNGQTASNGAAADGDKLQSTLSQLSNLLGDRLLEGVVSKAVDRCQDRLLSGDWTINSDAQKKLENLKASLDVEFSTVEENFLSLPSQDTSSAKLLPSTEEIFDAEVMPQ